MVVGDRGDDDMDCHVQCSLYLCHTGRRDMDMQETCRLSDICTICFFFFPSLVWFCSNLVGIFVFGWAGDGIHAA